MVVMEICIVGNIFNMSKFRHLIKISQHKLYTCFPLVQISYGFHKHNMNNSLDKNMNSNKI